MQQPDFYSHMIMNMVLTQRVSFYEEAKSPHRPISKIFNQF